VISCLLFLRDIGFNFLSVRVIIRQCGVHMSVSQMRIFEGNIVGQSEAAPAGVRGVTNRISPDQVGVCPLMPVALAHLFEKPIG
jgi:hypothetical protein